jgi:hypothetical protein
MDLKFNVDKYSEAGVVVILIIVTNIATADGKVRW